MTINPCIEEVLITHKQIVDKCKELGERITKDYEGKKPILIGLLKGAIPFLAELVKHIECDMEMEFIDVSSYAGVESTGQIRILKDISTNVRDRHIILVDDIIDSGLTLYEVIKLIESRYVASVETMALIDKPEGRKISVVKPKYVGYVIPNKFVVGFGLDYNELYRNLPYIGVLKPSVYQN